MEENITSVTSKDFVSELVNNGYNFFTGVPCSIFKNLLKYFSENNVIYRYIPAPREDAAIGMAAGSFFAGSMPAVIMQNSGLGYCLNALTSLNLIYKIPALLLVSWRGYQGKDAPEHLIMGDICTKLCEVSGIPHYILEGDKYQKQLKEVTKKIIQTSIPHAIFVKKGVIK